jgi:hypothetical protein
MDINNEARKILKKLGYEDIEFEVKKARHYFPYGASATDKEGIRFIQFIGNEPSLTRLGLAHFIAHELAHFRYRELNEPHPEEDFQPEFRKLEREMIEKIWALCDEEHKNSKG